MKKRWEIVFLHKHRRGPKLSIAEIAKEVKVSRYTVTYWLERYDTTKNVKEEEKVGRPRKTTPSEDKWIMTIREKKPETPTKKILKKRKLAISQQTFNRRVQEGGYTFKPKVVKPLLSQQHQKKRLEWAKTNKDTDWNQVLFTDETTFTLFQFRKKAWQRVDKPVIARSVKHP